MWKQAIRLCESISREWGLAACTLRDAYQGKINDSETLVARYNGHMEKIRHLREELNRLLSS